MGRGAAEGHTEGDRRRRNRSHRRSERKPQTTGAADRSHHALAAGYAGQPGKFHQKPDCPCAEYLHTGLWFQADFRHLYPRNRLTHQHAFRGVVCGQRTLYRQIGVRLQLRRHRTHRRAARSSGDPLRAQHHGRTDQSAHQIAFQLSGHRPPSGCRKLQQLQRFGDPLPSCIGSIRFFNGRILRIRRRIFQEYLP